MLVRNFVKGAAVLAMLMSTTGIARALSPEDVWASWQSLSATMGQQVVAANTTRDGDVLRLTDVKGDAVGPNGSVEGTIPLLELRQQGNDVAITLSDSYTVTAKGSSVVEADDGTDQEVTSEVRLDVSHPGLAILASGTVGDITYDYEMPTLGIAFDEILVDGEATPGVQLEVAATATTGKARVREGDLVSVDSEGTVDLITFAVAGENPETAESFNMAFGIADTVSRSSNSWPMGVSLATTSAALDAGLRAEGTVSYGAVNGVMEIGGETATTITGAVAGGEGSYALNGERLEYSVVSRDGTLTVVTPALANADATVGYASSSFAMSLPSLPSDEVTDFALRTEVTDLTASETLWSLFDPEQVLDRAPGTLLLDTTGKGRLTVDIFDPAMQAQPENPGEIEALDLNAFRLAFGGADLSATGAFTFDNSDLEARGGVPLAVGAVDLTLKGGPMLIDNLVKLGLLPQEQAMFAKMMLMGVARPGPTPDTLVSRIEMTEDGRILANGMEMQ